MFIWLNILPPPSVQTPWGPTSFFLDLYSACILFIYFSLEYNCFTMLVSAVQWSESAICIHISPPSWTSPPHTHPGLIPPIQVIKEHRAELPVLYSRFPLAIYFTHGSVFMSNLIFQFIPSSPSPAPCPHICSLHLCFYSCPSNSFICTIFLDSTYMG